MALLRAMLARHDAVDQVAARLFADDLQHDGFIVRIDANVAGLEFAGVFQLGQVGVEVEQVDMAVAFGGGQFAQTGSRLVQGRSGQLQAGPARRL